MVQFLVEHRKAIQREMPLFRSKKIIIGVACFLVGALGLALADTGALRPELFIALPWTWSAVQTFGDGDLVLSGSSSGSAIIKAPATGGGTVTLPTGSGTLSYGPSGANPTATATGTAINGSASTFMRSDAAPAIQNATSSQKGLVQVDGSTITASSGVISAVGGGSGTVTSVVCGTGLSGGTITTSGTCALDATSAITWSGVQQFNSGDLKLKGATSGTITLNAAGTAGTNTLTLPAGTTDFSSTGGTSQVVKQTSSGGAFTVARLACADLSDSTTACSTSTGTSGATIPLLNGANTWSGVQTFSNADLSLAGSSSGHTLLEAAAAASGTISLPAVTDTVAVLGTAQSWTATQSSTPQSLTISTSTFTPAAASGNNIKFTLVHASCPCTLANPSGTPVAGTSGVIEITQSATGSDTIGTWGSSYLYAGGTSTITLSTGANNVDLLSYYVRDSTHIVLTTAALNATH